MVLPDNFMIRTAHREMYKELQQEKKIFKLQIHLFTAALAIGFINNVKSQQQPRHDIVRLNQLHGNLRLYRDTIHILTQIVCKDKDRKDCGAELLSYADGGLELLWNDYQAQGILDLPRIFEETKKIWTTRPKATRKPSSRLNSELLRDFESELRLFIQSSLEQTVGKNWWKQAVPPDVREKCKERKEKGERLPWMDAEDYPLIFYADFSDYFKIITRRDNWRKIFSKIFIDEAWIKTKLLLELTPIRNNISHNRELKPDSVQKLRLSTKEILRCIRKGQTFSSG